MSTRDEMISLVKRDWVAYCCFIVRTSPMRPIMLLILALLLLGPLNACSCC